MATADAVGSLAMTASVLLNISPFRDVHDINRTKSVTERSILPYCMMMVDGANWTVYAILIDDIFPIGITNGFGAICGTIYASIYLRNCWNDKRDGVRRRAWFTLVAALSVIGVLAAAAVLISIFWSMDIAADRLGYVIDFFTMLLYGSPLGLALKVLRTGSTSGMYLPLTLTIIAASALWSTYGALTLDWFVVVPQSVGLLAGVAQLALFITFGIADNNMPSTMDEEPSSSLDEGMNGENGAVGNGDGGSDRKNRDGDTDTLNGTPSPSGLSDGDPPGQGQGRKPGRKGRTATTDSSKDQMREPLIPDSS